MFEEDKEDKDWIDKWMDRIGGFLCLLAVTGSLLLFVISCFIGCKRNPWYMKCLKDLEIG